MYGIAVETGRDSLALSYKKSKPIGPLIFATWFYTCNDCSTRASKTAESFFNMAVELTDQQLDEELDYSDLEAKFAPKLSFPLASALLVDGARESGKFLSRRLYLTHRTQLLSARRRRAVLRACSRSSLSPEALPLPKSTCPWTVQQDRPQALFSSSSRTQLQLQRPPARSTTTPSTNDTRSACTPLTTSRD